MSFLKYNELKVGDLITPYYFNYNGVKAFTHHQQSFYIHQYTVSFQGKKTRYTDAYVGNYIIHLEPHSSIAIILSHDNATNKMKVYCCGRVCFLRDAFGIEYKKL